MEFAQRRGLLSMGEVRPLRQWAGEHPDGAQAAFAAALRLRGALIRLFEAIASGRRPPKVDLAVLNAFLPRAYGSLRLTEADAGCGWASSRAEGDLERPLHPSVRAASELLTSPGRLARVRTCAADDCRWLFEDTSKNRSRRWCDMASCGNRAKARRHDWRSSEGA